VSLAERCDAAVLLASRLVALGVSNFTLTCVSWEAGFLAKGLQLARRHGVLPFVRFEVFEPTLCMGWRNVSIVLAREVLHRCRQLERVVDLIREGIADEGLLLVSESIGRNGHRQWPEGLEIVDRVWSAMPQRYKLNHASHRFDDIFHNRGRGRSRDDGVRSEDVLPVLLDKMHFEVFVAFGCIMDALVNRQYGPNFDPHRAEDRAFIDELASLDETSIDCGVVKPTHMMAAAHPQPGLVRRYFGHRSPEFCVRYKRPKGAAQPACGPLF
jgi:hypothetical protein